MPISSRFDVLKPSESQPGGLPSEAIEPVSDLAAAAPRASEDPLAGRSAGLATAEDWRTLFASYPAIVLVANSDEVDVDVLRASVPGDALFVFFNQVFKVLDRTFEGNSLLAVRSGSLGVKIVRRGEVSKVTSYFAPDRFAGILCLRAGSMEKVTPASAFGGVPTGHLDLTDYFADFYPPDLLPSTGFAMAVWLSELGLGKKIILAGFSAKRSENLKLGRIHDWTFEQVVQRLLVGSGRLSISNRVTPYPYKALMERFPEIPASDISLAAAEVLSERLANANAEIDRLISTTRTNRAVTNLFRKLKPIEMFFRRPKRDFMG
jgi:hypothetical protein